MLSNLYVGLVCSSSSCNEKKTKNFNFYIYLLNKQKQLQQFFFENLFVLSLACIQQHTREDTKRTTKAYEKSMHILFENEISLTKIYQTGSLSLVFELKIRTKIQVDSFVPRFFLT